MKKKLFLAFLAVLLFTSSKSFSQEGFLGEVRLFAGNFAPRTWAYCDGQLLSISQNTALFSILGTTYGGDGRTTFALPDLRGRVPVGPRNGPGLSSVRLGQKTGTESVTLTIAQIPSHNHTAVAGATSPVGRGGSSSTPTAKYWADGGNYATTKNTQMATDAVTVGDTGGSQSHENRQPSLGLNYIICTQGVFPSRN